MSKPKYNWRSIVPVLLGIILTGAATTIVITTQLKAHMVNDYVHHDIKALEETFVREDVLSVQLGNIDETLKAIKAKLEIE